MNKSPLVVASRLAAATAVNAAGDRVEIDDGDWLVEPLNLTVENLEDATLFDPTGERIGEVDDAPIAPDDTTMAVSLDVGGFLGIGTRQVVMPLDSISTAEGGVSVNLTEDGFEALPDYDN